MNDANHKMRTTIATWGDKRIFPESEIFSPREKIRRHYSSFNKDISVNAQSNIAGWYNNVSGTVCALLFSPSLIFLLSCLTFHSCSFWKVTCLVLYLVSFFPQGEVGVSQLSQWTLCICSTRAPAVMWWRRPNSIRMREIPQRSRPSESRSHFQPTVRRKARGDRCFFFFFVVKIDRGFPVSSRRDIFKKSSLTEEPCRKAFTLRVINEDTV